MAYQRGDVYAWCDGDDVLHLWVLGGDDWAAAAASGWAEARLGPGAIGAVKLPLAALDEFVRRRHAELADAAEQG